MGPNDAEPNQSPFTPGFAPECLACPIGMVFFAVRNTKPEAMEHLMKAGFELFQAFRVLVESYGDRWDRANARTMQRIKID